MKGNDGKILFITSKKKEKIKEKKNYDKRN